MRATYHPSYLLRQEGLTSAAARKIKRDAWEDFLSVMERAGSAVVLHDNEGHAAGTRQVRKKSFKGSQATGGGADTYDRETRNFLPGLGGICIRRSNGFL